MADLSQLAEHALARDPARPAVEFEGRWFSWGELARLASQLRALLGEIDGAVAFVARNRPSALAALLGLITEARVIRMIYAFQLPTGIARDIVRSGVGVVIADADDMTDEVIDTGCTAIALDGMSARLIALQHTHSETELGEPRIEILTSGTTGPPKPFAIPYALIKRHFLDSSLTRQQGDDAASQPPFLLYFPLGNISGIYSTLPMLLRGQRVTLLERFSLDAWADHVRRYRPEHSGLPPSFIGPMLDADIPKEDIASLKRLGVGAAPLDPALQQAFEDRYGIPILLSYGATEFAGPVACMTLDLHRDWGRSKLGTVGRAIPGMKLRIVAADSGAEQPPGGEGLLEVVCPRIGPEWGRTSDIAMIDADGFLFLRGRADGAIMRGGFKILPESIERALKLHPGVAEACAAGIADSRLGQAPAVALVARGDQPPLADLEAHLRRLLLATHIPTQWRFVDELPRNSSLKIDRRAVAALFDQR